MDKALLFGSKDCRFESCQGHILTPSPTRRHHRLWCYSDELILTDIMTACGIQVADKRQAVGKHAWETALPAGLEPATLRLTASRSNQLSYGSDANAKWHELIANCREKLQNTTVHDFVHAWLLIISSIHAFPNVDVPGALRISFSTAVAKRAIVFQPKPN